LNRTHAERNSDLNVKCETLLHGFPRRARERLSRCVAT
jgi:hypothetical protein